MADHSPVQVATVLISNQYRALPTSEFRARFRQLFCKPLAYRDRVSIIR